MDRSQPLTVGEIEGGKELSEEAGAYGSDTKRGEAGPAHDGEGRPPRGDKRFLSGTRWSNLPTLSESGSQRKPPGASATAPDRYHLNRMGAADAPQRSELARSQSRRPFLSR